MIFFSIKLIKTNIKATDMIWLAKKQFLVSFIRENQEPLYTYYDVFVDKVTTNFLFLIFSFFLVEMEGNLLLLYII